MGAVGTLLQFPPPPSQTFRQPEGRSDTGESSFFPPSLSFYTHFLRGWRATHLDPSLGAGGKKELKWGEKWAGEFQMVC